MWMTLPSGFYESLDGLKSFQVSAVCCGVRRSATTMIFQILRDIFPQGGVVKTHTFLDVPPNTPVIATIRDFRDCAVSWWRTTKHDNTIRNAEYIAKLLSETAKWSLALFHPPASTQYGLSLEDVVRIAGLIKTDLLHTEAYSRCSRYLLLRYEDFVSRPDSIAVALENFLQIPVAEEVIEQHNLQHNWGLKRWGNIPEAGWNVEQATGPIADGHCHDGATGTWRSFCDSTATPVLEELLRPELLRYGYEQEKAKGKRKADNVYSDAEHWGT